MALGNARYRRATQTKYGRLRGVETLTKNYVSFFVGLMLVLASGPASGQENASNPLAAVSNTDLRFQYIDLGGSHLKDIWVDGAYMVAPKLKVKYELHY